MAQQLPDTYYRTPYKFNGKELDEETGLYYYGARYYDPKISIWLSVDPLAESFPNWNPYNYTMQNPINLVDPTGMAPEDNDHEWDRYWKNGQVVKTVRTGFNGGDKVDFVNEIDLDKSVMFSNTSTTVMPVKHESATVDTNISAQDGNLFYATREPGYNLTVTYKGKSQAIEAMGFDSPFFVVGGLSNLFTKTTAAKGVMNTSEIHFMQSSIKNTTGNYTVLGNAESLANGSLNPNVLRMNVWKDASGKVWTLDHRRLGAFKLSGLEQAPIQWANPSGQMWKMTTTNGGTSIKLKLGGGNNMIIK